MRARFAPLLFMLFVATGTGCRSAGRPAAPAQLPTIEPAPGPAPGAATVPLLRDPGPAAERPLHAGFERPLLAEGGWIRILVDLRTQADLGAIARAHDAAGLPRTARRERTLRALEEVAARGRAALEPLLERMVRDGTADYYRQVRFRNRYFVSLRPDALELLRAHPAVADLIPEYDSVRDARRTAGSQRVAHAPPVPPGDSWGVTALGLRELWNEGIDGRGVVIGILDSGVFGDHLALAPGRRGDPDWFDPATGAATPIDTVPHGSQVLSCALGREVRGHALGAAPGASWAAALSNLHNSYNNVNMSLAADWLLFEAKPDVLLGAWGHGHTSCYDHDRPMLEAFRAAGVVAVFAAGNDGPAPATGETPAALDPLHRGGALVVAASDRRGQVIDASSRGPNRCGSRLFPDVAAPGWEIPAPAPPRPESLTLVSGTSFAVGFVGGIAAMILQLQPEMPVADVEEIIRTTATDLPPAGHDPVSGYGLLNPKAAIDRARSWKPTNKM